MPSVSISVAVSGTGKMGRQVAETVRRTEDLELVAFVDGLASVDAIEGTPVFREPGKCFAQTSPAVVVDFTNAAFTPVLADAAIAASVRPVIGTSGLSSEFVVALGTRLEQAGLGGVVASNFAVGAVLLMHFARRAAPYFDNAEIIELHHDQKVDAPSGTAVTTAELMRQARGRDFAHPPTERETLPGSRGADYAGIAIHSVRLPGLVAHQEVLFGGLGQTLSLRHDSTGRDSFMPGVLLAIRAVVECRSLVVGLDSLLGLG